MSIDAAPQICLSSRRFALAIPVASAWRMVGLVGTAGDTEKQEQGAGAHGRDLRETARIAHVLHVAQAPLSANGARALHAIGSGHDEEDGRVTCENALDADRPNRRRAARDRGAEGPTYRAGTAGAPVPDEESSQVHPAVGGESRLAAVTQSHSVTACATHRKITRATFFSCEASSADGRLGGRGGPQKHERPLRVGALRAPEALVKAPLHWLVFAGVVHHRPGALSSLACAISAPHVRIVTPSGRPTRVQISDRISDTGLWTPLIRAGFALGTRCAWRCRALKGAI